MPELPEVERFRTLLSPLRNRTVRLQLLAPHRGIVGIEQATEFHCRGILRKGKQICLQTSEQRTLCLHMGMTGSIRVQGKPTNWGHADAPLVPEDQDWPPRFAYVSISILDDPSYIACFCDPRKFGKVQFVDSDSDKILADLAPDALDCEVDKALVERLAHQRLSVKALLLDQKRIVSGVGNWVADEVLYQTNIHPEQSFVTIEEAKLILEKLQDILRTAVECLNADRKYPETWLFGFRWTKKSSGKDFYQRPIRFVTVGGRTSAIVREQKLYQRREKKANQNSKTNLPKQQAVEKGSSKKRSTEHLQQFRRSPRLAR